MDMPAPVANQITSPPPGSSLNTMLGFLDVAKSRQALQLGQQQVAQAQMETGRQKSVQSFFKSWDPSKYVSPDGTTDVDKAMGAPEFQQADGLAKPGIAEALQGIKSRQMGVKGQLQTLDDDSIQGMAQGLQGIQQDEDVLKGTQAGKDKVHQFYDAFAQRSPQAQRISNIYRQVVDGAPQGKLSEAVGAQAAMAQDVSATRPQFGTLADGRTAVRDPIRQTIWLPQERRMANPGEVAAFKPVAGGGASSINVTTPQVAAQTAASEGAAKGITERVQQAQSQANNTTQAQDALMRARTILDDPNVLTGKGFTLSRDAVNILASAGIDTPAATDANSLVKNLARYEAARATAAGLGSTDAARELSHNGSPNVAIDRNALQGIVTQSLATEKALAAYSNVQSRHNGNYGAQSKNEAAFRSIPNLIEGYEYGLARNNGEADEFLKRHGLSKEQMAITRAQIKKFEKL